jgi:hypothetical protein
VQAKKVRPQRSLTKDGKYQYGQTKTKTLNFFNQKKKKKRRRKK